MQRLLALLFIIVLFVSCGTENNPTYTLTVTANPSEGGTVSPSTGVYPENEVVSVTATANNGWQFVRWEGDWSGLINPTNITLNKNYTLVAVFERRNYPLTVNIDGLGAVTERIIQPKTTEYPYQTQVELTPVPDEGWYFDEWQGDLSGDESPKIITVDTEKEVMVVFKRRMYPLTVLVEGEGSVTETVITQKTTNYPFETLIELSAEPSIGWSFISWSGDLTGSESPKQIRVDGEKYVTARFEINKYKINLSIVGEGTVLFDPDFEEFLYGTEVEITPLPSIGWEFSNWSGDVTSSTIPEFVTVDSVKNITAQFQIKTYKINLATEGSGTLQIEPQLERYPHGTEVQISPIPSIGWRFISWGSDVTGSEFPISLTLTEELSISAFFERKNYPLSVLVFGQGEVVEEIVNRKSTDYPYETIVRLTPKPEMGWEFVSWGGDLNGSDFPQEIEVNSETHVTATFREPLRPTVLSESVSNITPNSIEFTGIITDQGSSAVISRGACYVRTINLDGLPLCENSGLGAGSFNVSITGLISGESYSVRAFARNAIGASYGEWIEFLTLGTLPTVITNPVSSIERTSATLNGNVTNQGSSNLIRRGFCYSTSQNVNYANRCVYSGSAIGSFTANVTGLNPAQTYYVRALAVNSVGTVWGNEVTFKTLAAPVIPTLPTVSTSSISKVTTSNAEVSGNVSSQGTSTVTKRGFVWNTTGNPTINANLGQTSNGSGVGSFTGNLNNLQPRTRYFIRAYAINSVGTSYANQLAFTTASTTENTNGRDNTTTVVDVYNPKTGRTWMDRNLGATRVATSSTDTQAYGDLYQWGRLSDGHQKRNSKTTTTLNTTDIPAHGSFIVVSNSPFDWRSPQNNNLWQGVNGINNPCPIGYRIPTISEWNEELTSWVWGSMSSPASFTSVLKLPFAGNRYGGTGIIGHVYEAVRGMYWSSTISLNGAQNITVSHINSSYGSITRSFGNSVRCIKN